LAEEFQRVHQVDLRLEPHTHQDLWDKAEIMKKNLSFRDSVTETLSSGDKSLRVDLDRETFNGMIDDIIKQTGKCMDRVIQAAGLDWSKIDTILLAGGSSRIPAVKDMIKKVTNKDIAMDLNPDECVAMGAAVQATLVDMPLNGEGATSSLPGASAIVVQDVASHSLGVKALSSDRKGYINSIIIPRNSAIPCEKSKTYTTNEDNQKQVEIEVLQGESEDPYSPEVSYVGKVSLKKLPPHKAGELVVEITLRYNVDGMIEVVAKESKSGQMTREIVMQKVGTLSEEIIQEKIALLDQTEL
jgi:molecular chaperone DnaK